MCSAHGTNGTNLDLEDQGYTLVPLTFVGPVGSDGTNVTLNGTVDEIHAQILKINPSYNGTSHGHANANAKRGLEERCGGQVHCQLGYKTAKMSPIETGVAYLEQLVGECGVDAGPQVCGRISCSDSSGIFLCNDVSGSLSFSTPLRAVAACSLGRGRVDRTIPRLRYHAKPWVSTLRGPFTTCAVGISLAILTVNGSMTRVIGMSSLQGPNARGRGLFG